jgi:hypothetical protein
MVFIAGADSWGEGGNGGSNLHAVCNFHTHECNFDTYDTLECDLYTQSVTSTCPIVI